MGTSVLFRFCLALAVATGCAATGCGSTSYKPLPAEADAGSDLAAGFDAGVAPPPGSVVPPGGMDAGSGPALETIVSGIGRPSNPSYAMPLEAIAVDAQRIYVIASENDSTYNTFILTIAIGGGTPTVLVDYQKDTGNVGGGFSGLALDSAYVYSGGVGVVYRVPSSGGAVGEFFPYSSGVNPNFSGVATNGSLVCWYAPGGISCKPTNSGPGPAASLLANGSLQTESMQIDATHVYYWRNDGADSIVLARIPVSGGTPASVGSGSLYTTKGIAVDDKYAYWAASTPTRTCSIQRAPKDGGNGAVPIAWWSCPTALPSAVAVNATHVWFTTSDGQVKRFVKP